VTGAFGMLGRMQRNRLLLLVAALGVAAVVAVVLIVASIGGSSSSTTTAKAAADGPTTKALFAGIPQHGDTLGDPGAPATLTVYEDPQCPFCQQWNVNTLPTVLDTFVRTGRVKLVYHGVEIIGPNSVDGLRAIYAAGAQNKLWTFADALYTHQGEENSGWITPEVIRASATEAGANGDAILTRAKSSEVTSALKAAEAEAITDKLRGTPTFVLQKQLGPRTQVSAPLDPSGFSAALSAALQ
jgi:protein-disulfide isomerase